MKQLLFSFPIFLSSTNLDLLRWLYLKIMHFSTIQSNKASAERNKWYIAALDVICLPYGKRDIFRCRETWYDINPPTPADISLAEGEYHTRRAYHKSTQWIYIITKGSLSAAFCMAEWEGFEPSRAFWTPTPLAGEPLRPLGYHSNSDVWERDSLVWKEYGGESGIRTHGPSPGHRFSRPAP